MPRRSLTRKKRRKGHSGLSVGEIYDVTIQGLSRRGEGIAKVNGITIFIPGARIKERVSVKIVKVLRSYAIGRILE
ncbi:MAG: deoxyribonuclease [Thermoprotei archaeon]|nr:MAG: deoxyribonuclease [Thermoprotei archaeon]RLF03008.1 MAG: deoxyribonuclease [Thermoprotei archaeon]